MSEKNTASRPIVLGWLADRSRVPRRLAPDGIYERLLAEVFDEPSAIRSHVITLHLYVEYWLDRILGKLGLPDDTTFHKKVKALDERGVLEAPLAGNISTINKLRNIYAHELDLPAANTRVRKLLGELWIDPCFQSNDPDPLRVVCIQVMFLLEATFHNDCRPPKLPEHPSDEPRQRLAATGKLHWQECEILSTRNSGYVEHYELRCPSCRLGTIHREHDGTPGFKEASMSACLECGLTGDGYELDAATAGRSAV